MSSDTGSPDAPVSPRRPTGRVGSPRLTADVSPRTINTLTADDADATVPLTAQPSPGPDTAPIPAAAKTVEVPAEPPVFVVPPPGYVDPVSAAVTTATLGRVRALSTALVLTPIAVVAWLSLTGGLPGWVMLVVLGTAFGVGGAVRDLIAYGILGAMTARLWAEAALTAVLCGCLVAGVPTLWVVAVTGGVIWALVRLFVIGAMVAKVSAHQMSMMVTTATYEE